MVDGNTDQYGKHVILTLWLHKVDEILWSSIVITQLKF